MIYDYNLMYKILKKKLYMFYLTPETIECTKKLSVPYKEILSWEDLKVN